MSQLIQVIYASAATAPFTPETLRVLLTKSRSRNTLYGVSGILLYHGGSILQVLEGLEESVNLILASVEKDSRHERIRYLSRGPIKNREFQAWSMGFVDPSAGFLRSAGYVDYGDMVRAMSDSASHARKLLRFFQQGLYRQGYDHASSGTQTRVGV